jgi:hypothetical protein
VELLKNILDAPTGTNKSWSEDSVESLGKDVRSFMMIREGGAAINSLNDAILVLAKIVQGMKEKDLSLMKPAEAAKTGAYLVKIADEMVRLLEFSKGNPDSRPDVGIGELLKYLDAAQFAQLTEWVAAGKAKVVNAAGDPYQS